MLKTRLGSNGVRLRMQDLKIIYEIKLKTTHCKTFHVKNQVLRINPVEFGNYNFQHAQQCFAVHGIRFGK
jgi:hypothetical protein